MELIAAGLTSLLQLVGLYFFARVLQQADRHGRIILALVAVLVVLLRAGWFFRAAFPEWLILSYSEAEFFGELVVSALLFLGIYHTHRLERERREAQTETRESRELSRQAKVALSDSRLKLDAIVNSVEAILWEADAQDFRFIFVSQQAERLLGFPLARWLQEPTFWSDHIHPDDRTPALAFYRQASVEKVEYEFEYRMTATDGRVLWLHDIFTVVVEKGQATKLRGLLMDITERKRTEQLLTWEMSALALVAAPASLNETLDELMIGLEKQLPGALCSVLLLDRDEVHLRHGGAPSLPAAYCQAIDGVAIGPKVGSCGTAAYLGQSVIVSDIGSDPLWADFRDLTLKHGLQACWSTPVRSDAGKIVGTFAIYYRTPRSPTPAELELIERAKHLVSIAIERKRVAEALKDSEALYHSLVESLPLSVFRKDLAGRFTFANAQFCATIGKALPDLLGKSDFDIAPASLAEKYRADDERVASTGTVFEAVEEHPVTTGRQRYVQVLKSPVRNAEKQIIGIQGVLRDITGQRELEEQFRQSQKMDSIGQLAGGVAHDFNNLLTIIQGYTEMVMTDERMPVEMASLLGEVHAAGERAAGLTRQLLTFSRKQMRHLETINLNEVIATAARLLQRVIGEDITIRLETASSLPPVHADAGMMDQILMNLAINARDAMSQGGRLTIRTASAQIAAANVQQNREAREGRFVCLTVSDTGCGMGPEIQARVFEPFFTTKETGKGTGLGLATVFGIVKQHEGWIEVESAVGAGTTFKVFLPAVVNQASPDLSQPIQPKVRGGSETILLVEDEDALRELAALILRKHGYHILEAASGVQALAVWLECARDIDLLLTDMVMPHAMSGRELAKHLTSEKPALKVIYVSGYNPNFGDLNFGLKEGLNFLQKPYHPRQLAQTVRDCLDR